MTKKNKSSDRLRQGRVALGLMALALGLLFWSLLGGGDPGQDASSKLDQSSVQPAPTRQALPDLTELELRLRRERHHLNLDFERLASQSPASSAQWPGPPPDRLELEGERIRLDELDPSFEADRTTPRNQILHDLQEAQRNKNWRDDRNRTFIQDFLRRAEADGWRVELDEELNVTRVKRIKPGPYRDSGGDAAR